MESIALCLFWLRAGEPSSRRCLFLTGHALPATFRTHGFDELEFDRYTEFHLLSRELTETTASVLSSTSATRSSPARGP